ncbi:hypothetical protein BMR02_00675 [Methylococcaceae bacterium HT1]|nr:hypothetical protein BMR02_00675 [Methylococcaceae bacterium HT1]TXL18310.1 hypothetical protein BMR04_01635 [Methylococcaceae bacterium HT3]
MKPKTCVILSGIIKSSLLKLEKSVERGIIERNRKLLKDMNENWNKQLILVYFVSLTYTRVLYNNNNKYSGVQYHV